MESHSLPESFCLTLRIHIIFSGTLELEERLPIVEDLRSRCRITSKL